jgi:hypothetical protein
MLKIIQQHIRNIKQYLCGHYWADFKFRHFEDEKMDDKGRSGNMLLTRTCEKCEKIEVIALKTKK